jgi:hypothetical protein
VNNQQHLEERRWKAAIALYEQLNSYSGQAWWAMLTANHQREYYHEVVRREAIDRALKDARRTMGRQGQTIHVLRCELALMRERWLKIESWPR